MSCPLLPVCNVGQTVGWTKKKLGVQVGLGPGHTVLVEDPAPPSTKGHSPRFSAHICCGQIAEWIKMLLGMEPGLGPSSFVLDGDRAPPSQKGRSPQIFGPCLAGWIKMVLGMEISLSPSEFVLDGDPSTSPKGDGAPSQFSAHFYCGQTAGCIKMPDLSPKDFVLSCGSMSK